MTSSSAAVATLVTAKDLNGLCRRFIVFATILVVTAGATALTRAAARTFEIVAPAVGQISPAAVLLNETLIRVPITAAWQKVDISTTHRALLSDWTLWRRMHVDNWDRVPSSLRHRALDALLDRYGHLLTNPAAWDGMDAHAWDLVPQPIRAFAFRHMVEYWSGYYDVGGKYGIPPGLMANTMAAIVMTESWFEHRAEHVNPWGNRDLGVAQASDGARERLRQLYADGQVDVFLENEDYFNPWQGTRFVALWMRLLLDRVDGDLPTAIRAYHRGWRRALAGEGVDYLNLVRRRRIRYIMNRAHSPSWNYLWNRDRALVDAAWPWMHVLGDWQTGAQAAPATSRSGTPDGVSRCTIVRIGNGMTISS
jgi:hypothetical protein